MIGSANAAWGSATPKKVFASSRSRISRNSGMIATVRGNSRPSVNTRNRGSRPRKVYRASGYAAITPNTTTTAVVTSATIEEFSANCQKVDEVITLV